MWLHQQRRPHRNTGEKQGKTGKKGKKGKKGKNREKQGKRENRENRENRIRVGYAEFQNRTKRAKARTRNRNVTENNIGVLQMKVEQGETRPGPGNQVWRNKSEFRYGVT